MSGGYSVRMTPWVTKSRPSKFWRATCEFRSSHPSPRSWNALRQCWRFGAKGGSGLRTRFRCRNEKAASAGRPAAFRDFERTSGTARRVFLGISSSDFGRVASFVPEYSWGASAQALSCEDWETSGNLRRRTRRIMGQAQTIAHHHRPQACQLSSH